MFSKVVYDDTETMI